MSDAAILQAGGLAYREQAPDGAARGTVVCVHGFPASSWMWRETLARAAAVDWRAIAPDMPGSGDSPPDPPGTWERAVGALERFHGALGLGPVVLVVHDWGGLIGLRWACEHPELVRGLVISSTGFFTDGRWHGLAEAMRTPGQGEELIDGLTPEGFTAMMAQICPAMDELSIAEYWKAFADPVRRRGHLELYRSGDFAKLEPYRGRLAALAVPTLVLWGEEDPFAPLAGARRLEAEIPGARLQILGAAKHFIYDEDPERSAAAVAGFLAGLG